MRTFLWRLCLTYQLLCFGIWGLSPPSQGSLASFWIPPEAPDPALDILLVKVPLVSSLASTGHACSIVLTFGPDKDKFDITKGYIKYIYIGLLKGHAICGIIEWGTSLIPALQQEYVVSLIILASFSLFLRGSKQSSSFLTPCLLRICSLSTQDNRYSWMWKYFRERGY